MAGRVIYGGASTEQLGEAVKQRDSEPDVDRKRELNLIVHSGTFF